ncbi:hypothetical protein LTR27_003488 [Elasticomyces elasticus]|nr:hypothetical protein LTR27_003488 [Elasticomyces elasticus]
MDLRRRKEQPPLRKDADPVKRLDPVRIWRKTPLMGVCAAIVTFGGALDLLEYTIHSKPDRTPQSLDKVSGIYGPGSMFGWLLAVILMMYDEYYYGKRKSTSWYADKVRFALVVGFASYAVYDQLSRAWSGDFGASHAAARYVVDKAFESAAIMFFISAWRDQMNIGTDAQHTLPTTERLEARDPFEYWPAIVLFLAWALGRASEIGRNAYYPSRRHCEHPVWWKPLIPYELRPISFPCGMILGILTTQGRLKTRLFKGFSKGFWIAFAILHCGLFGTVGPLRLTDKSMGDPEQWLPLAIAVLGSFGQYWADIRALPHAAKDRVWNVFRWEEGPLYVPIPQELEALVPQELEGN